LIKYVLGILSLEIFHFYIQIRLVYNGFICTLYIE